MATKKKTTKKTVKKEENTIVLKLIGAIINSAAIALYTLANIPTVLASFGIVMHAEFNDVFTQQNVIDAMYMVNNGALKETAVLFGAVLFFELLNYFLYLRKSKDAILGMVVIEAVAFIVIGLRIGFGYPLLYIMLLPEVLGLIDYAILSKEGK